MALFKKVENDELYLFMNSKLIYKCWLKTIYSKVFDVMAYGKYLESGNTWYLHEGGRLVGKAIVL
ncbi:hypothetical protein [Polluticaenibacter yanchengensis]|uniref:Uncharacterized protein n=1 Tax=Polluticaenibacter yanchengensis TaxID=3014562 RepID=A0ABT4UIE3_9BACT|nr:hypothetical protein [Chitinophagaceae bacterium LY-5]